MQVGAEMPDNVVPKKAVENEGQTESTTYSQTDVVNMIG